MTSCSAILGLTARKAAHRCSTVSQDQAPGTDQRDSSGLDARPEPHGAKRLAAGWFFLDALPEWSSTCNVALS